MGALNTILARIKGQRVYIDTNIFVYFLEKHEQYFDMIVPFFQLFNEGLSFAYTGDATAAEILYKPYQKNDVVRISEFKNFFADDEFITVLPHTTAVFELAAEISPKLGMKLFDALHYATAVLAGCRYILTNDAGFRPTSNLEIIYLHDLVKNE